MACDGSRDHALVGELPGPYGGGPRLVAAVEITVGVRDHLRGQGLIEVGVGFGQRRED